MPWPENQLEEGFCSLHWTEPQRNNPQKVFWNSRAARSPAELIGALQWISRLPQTRDIYVCLSRQRVAETKIAKTTGREYHVAVRSSAGAVGLKAIFLDLDFKQYPKPADAVAAFKQFGRDVGLPEPSTIVMTGGGLHIYWTVDHLMPPHEWVPLAHGLSGAAQAHGLKCDTACTVDLARILRVPGTLNHKYTPLREAKLVHCSHFDYPVERLAPLLAYTTTVHQPANVVAFPLPSRPPLASSDLSAGIEALPPLSASPVLHECGFLGEAFRSGGVSNANPLWHLSVLASTWLERGRAMAHAFSSGHASYTSEETDELFDRKVRERKERNLGYPSCHAIKSAGATHCATCPHFIKGKSPLNLAVRALPAPVVTPAVSAALTAFVAPLPPTYERAVTGCIVRLAQDDEGQIIRIPVSSTPILNARLLKEPDGWVMLLTCRIGDKDEEVRISSSAIKSSDMRRQLQAASYMESDLGETGEFLVAWHNVLQNVKEAVLNPQPYGWIGTGGKTCFAYGGKLWSDEAPRLSAPPTKALADNFTPTGELPPWQQAAALITSQKRPDLNALLASAFAGPLIRFTGQPGLCMAAYSRESGVGKTTALQVAQAVWGHPVNAMNGLNDTANSVDAKLAALNSLPLYWDELKTRDDAKDFLNNLVFRLTGGKQKARLDRNSKLTATASWNTLLVSASNSSLVAPAVRHSTSSAPLMRIFEFQVRPGMLGQISPSEAAHVISQLRHHYGNVGTVYAQFLGANVGRAEKDVAAMQRWMEAQVGTTRTENYERYWVALCATLIQGAVYAAELGFVDLDVPELRKFLLQAFSAMRLQLDTQSVDLDKAINIADILLDYLTEVRSANQVLDTNYVYRGPGAPLKPVKLINKNPFTARAQTAWNVQVGAEDGTLLCRRRHFEDWCHRKEYISSDLLDAMKTKHNCVEFQDHGTLGARLTLEPGMDHPPTSFRREAPAHRSAQARGGPAGAKCRCLVTIATASLSSS